MARVLHRWRHPEESEDVQHPAELGRIVLGLPDNGIWQRLARVQSDLVKARTAAVERDRPVPAFRDLRMVGRSWGWLELAGLPTRRAGSRTASSGSVSQLLVAGRPGCWSPA